MLPKLRQYAVTEQDGEVMYWLLYDSLADAVSSHDGSPVIYVANFRPKGRYRQAVKLIKIKKRKKKKVR